MGLISTGYHLVPLKSPFSLCRSSVQLLNLYLTSSKLCPRDTCQGLAWLKGVGVLLERPASSGVGLAQHIWDAGDFWTMLLELLAGLCCPS